MKIIFTMFLSFCFVHSCLQAEEKDQKDEKSLLDKGKALLDEKVESSKKLLDKKIKGSQAKNWVKGDIENIGDWEYKIVAFADKAHPELEKELNQLGESRWQCFWVESAGKDKVFFFKRSKISYMHKMPAGEILEIIGDLKDK